MSGFRFSLQRLLDLRRQHEQALARELAAARDTAEHERARHDALRAAQDAARDAIAREASEGMPIGTLQSLGVATSHFGEHVDAAGERHRAAHAVVVEKHDALSTALQARRLLERLRERHLERHTTEARRRDGSLMDAIAITRFVRQQAGDPSSQSGGQS